MMDYTHNSEGKEEEHNKEEGHNKEDHEEKGETAEECLRDLLNQNLSPEEVIQQFKDKGYSLGGHEEKKEEGAEEEGVEEEEEEGVVDLKIQKVTVLGDDMEEGSHPLPRMGKLLRVARKAMKKERGE